MCADEATISSATIGRVKGAFADVVDGMTFDHARRQVVAAATGAEFRNIYFVNVQDKADMR